MTSHSVPQSATPVVPPDIFNSRRFWLVILVAAGLGGGISNTGLGILTDANDSSERLIRMETAVSNLTDDIAEMKATSVITTKHLNSIEQDLTAIKTILRGSLPGDVTP